MTSIVYGQQVVPQTVCEPNRTVCIDNTVQTCNPSGSGYDETKTIGCKSQGMVCGTPNGRLTCVNADTGYDISLFAVAVIIIVALAYLLVKKTRSKR